MSCLIYLSLIFTECLQVSDPYVLRILINNNRIERTYLSTSRTEGQTIVDGLPNGGLVWTTDGHIVRSYGPESVVSSISTSAKASNILNVTEMVLLPIRCKSSTLPIPEPLCSNRTMQQNVDGKHLHL